MIHMDVHVHTKKMVVFRWDFITMAINLQGWIYNPHLAPGLPANGCHKSLHLATIEYALKSGTDSRVALKHPGAWLWLCYTLYLATIRSATYTICKYVYTHTICRNSFTDVQPYIETQTNTLPGS